MKENSVNNAVKREKVKISHIIEYGTPTLFLLAGLLYDLRFLRKYGRLLLDSDMASEMVLADLLNKTGKIVSSDWVYSTEIRVFETQWFYRIGLLISPNNWHIARIIGTMMMLILLAFGIYLLGKASGWKQYSIWAAGFAMWPVGGWYCFQSTYGAYYLPYAIFSAWSMYLVIRISKTEIKNKKIVLCALLGLLAFMSGMNGVRQMMVFFAPLLLAAVLLLFLGKKGALIPSAIAFLSNGVGYAVNMFFLAKKYNFNTQSEYIWGAGSGSFFVSVREFFESFGYAQVVEVNYHRADIKLFSMNGIAMGCGLIVGMAIFASIIYLLALFKKLSKEDQILTAASVSMIFVVGMVFAYLYGPKQYWQQTMFFGYILLIIAIKNISLEKLKEAISIKEDVIRLIFGLFMALMVMISSKGTVSASINYPFRAQPELLKFVDWVDNQTDYKYGVAEFWKSNVITEWTDGRIEMYTVFNPKEPVSINLWLQKASHLDTYPTGKYFIVMQCENLSEDDESYSYILNELGGKVIYNDGLFIAFGVE